jgi:hypothetical protein
MDFQDLIEKDIDENTTVRDSKKFFEEIKKKKCKEK